MKNLLITGASGFVGKNLIPYLSESGYKIELCSLRETFPVSISGSIDGIIHLAGKAHDLKKVSDPDEYFSVNTELTKKLFDLFLISNASIFVFLSSVKASADTVESELTENNLPNPKTAYGQSKLQAESYILSHKLPEGKNIFILRPCMIHGPGNKGNLNLLYQFVKRNLPYPLAAFNNKRSFLSIENLCFICRELLERQDIPSGIYNIADEVPLSTTEVLSTMAEVLFKRPLVLKVNKRFIKYVAQVGDIIPIYLNSERLKKLTENYIVNTDKLKNVLFKPLPINSKDGIKISVMSFQSNRKYKPYK